MDYSAQKKFFSFQISDNFFQQKLSDFFGRKFIVGFNLSTFDVRQNF